MTPATAPSDHPGPLPQAILWDMDGTLVDTEPFWMNAERELTDRYGATWTEEDVLRVVGAGLGTTAGHLRERGVPLEPDEIIDRMTSSVIQALAEGEIPWRPGALELLREARAAGVSQALVTMSMAPMAHAIVHRMPFTVFDTVVTGDAVSRPKPHPDAYLAAAAALGVDAASSVAIEDSVPGVAAAVAAGAVTIAVPHVTQVPESADHETWPSLRGRTLGDLGEVMRRRGRR
ncbi:MAG TPA: HAD family phosphatase [Microbacteriaceae bacterium]|nr:HAD family phosphatase [Microbacteriaceae bacterium]